MRSAPTLRFLLTSALSLMAFTGAAKLDRRELSPTERGLVQAALFEHLKDPDSAKLRWPTFDGSTTYCGSVNAKNSDGGYVGYSAYMATVTTRDGTIIGVKNVLIHDAASEICSSLGYSLK